MTLHIQDRTGQVWEEKWGHADLEQRFLYLVLESDIAYKDGPAHKLLCLETGEIDWVNPSCLAGGSIWWTRFA